MSGRRSSSTMLEDPSSSSSKPSYRGPANRLSSLTDIRCIGSGTFGCVYRAFDSSLGRRVAIKRMKLHDGDEGLSPQTIREISVLRELEHPHIVRLEDVVIHNERIFLVFEWMETDLWNFLGEERYSSGVPIGLAKDMIRQLFSALIYVHSEGVLHRDLKPPNILLTVERQVPPGQSVSSSDCEGGKKKPDLGIATKITCKLCDFGLSRQCFDAGNRQLTREIVTLWYRPPEVLLGSRTYDESLDVWSMGCIIGEILTGKPLFEGKDEDTQTESIFRSLGVPNCEFITSLPLFNESRFGIFRDPQFSFANFANTRFSGLPNDAIDLISRCLQFNPSDRISTDAALSHPFLASSLSDSLSS